MLILTMFSGFLVAFMKEGFFWGGLLTPSPTVTSYRTIVCCPNQETDLGTVCMYSSVSCCHMCKAV